MVEAIFHPEDVFSIQGRGTVVTGRLESGVLGLGMTTKIGEIEAQVAGLETFRKRLETVIAGDPNSQALGVLLKEIKKEEVVPYIQSGQTLVFKGSVATPLVTGDSYSSNKLLGVTPEKSLTAVYGRIAGLLIVLLLLALLFTFLNLTRSG